MMAFHEKEVVITEIQKKTCRVENRSFSGLPGVERRRSYRTAEKNA